MLADFQICISVLLICFTEGLSSVTTSNDHSTRLYFEHYITSLCKKASKHWTKDEVFH